MPTTFAHDAFGKMVYQRLDSEIQELLQKNRMAYLIGLHGPDILFYTRPFHGNRINRQGSRMHQEKAKDFFERGKQLFLETQNEKIFSYLLGFLCHFMLDSTCHPYIGEYMKKTGAGHDEIETEFDRELMIEAGKDPFVYRPADVLKLHHGTVQAIALVLGCKEREIAHTIEAMKFYTGFTVCKKGVKRKFLQGIARDSGLYRLVQGRIMLEKPRERCMESTRNLKHLLWRAVRETAPALEEYYRAVLEEKPLSSRLDRNYE